MTAVATSPSPLQRLVDLDTPEVVATRAEATPRPLAAFASLCALLYGLVGAWVIRSGDFMIGDAAYRVANARVILFSRDPHLAALGLTWPPISTLAMLPVTALLEPFGLAWAAGAVTTGCFGGGIVLMIGRLAQHVGCGPVRTVVVLGVFAFNPVTIFWMGSSMMEAPAYFFLVWATVSFVRWLDDRTTSRLAIVGVALAGGLLSRFEQVLVVVVFCVLVAIAEEKGHRVKAATMVVVPTLFFGLVWLATNFVIRGNAFSFAPSSPPGGACASANVPLPVSLRDPANGVTSWCDLDLGLGDAARYGWTRMFAFAPMVLLVLPALVRDVWSSPRRSRVLAIVGATAAVPLFNTLLIAREQGTGNPRYWLTVLVMAPLIATVVLTWRRWWWVLATVVLLGAGLVTGLRLELNATYAGMESEHVALSAMTGLTATGGGGATAGGVSDWRRSAEIIDRATTDRDLIAADSSAAFTVLLFTDHLDRFAIPEDRDFEQLLGLTDTRFTYLVVSGSTNSATGADLQLAAIANGSAGGSFVKVADLPGVGTLYGRSDVVAPSDATDEPGSPSA